MSIIFRSIAVIAIVLISLSKVSAQETMQNKFIQCIFSNMEKPEQAQEFQDFLRTQDGVFMARANFNSRKFFLIYRSDSNINLSMIEDWMSDFNLTFKCVREGIHGVDKVIDQKLDCEE